MPNYSAPLEETGLTHAPSAEKVRLLFLPSSPKLRPWKSHDPNLGSTYEPRTSLSQVWKANHRGLVRGRGEVGNLRGLHETGWGGEAMSTTWSGPYLVAWGLETWDWMEAEREWETWLWRLQSQGRCSPVLLEPRCQGGDMPLQSIS